MTSISIRGDERQRVITALEAEYATDRAAADSMIRTVLDALQMRDTWGIRVDVGPTLHLAYGPWFHSAAVNSVARRLPGSSVHRMYSPARLLELMDPRTHAVETKCFDCLHPMFAHGFGAKGCVVKKCRCRRVA